MVHRLAAGDKKIVLVGTAHVSKDSVQLVEQVIQDEQPDTVCVELCQSRYQAIRQQDHWQNMDIVRVIKEKKAMLLLSNLLLASFQKRIAKKFDIRPGQEMIQAIESADAIGANVEMADRDIRVTLLRTWRAMGLWGKLKLVFQLLMSLGDVDEIEEEDIEKMKQEDILESLLAEVGKSLPQLKEILIDERDLYLTEKIRSAPGNTIVAVVGAGHVPGIQDHWDQQIDMNRLETLPPPSGMGKVLKWMLPAAILGLLAYGFFSGGVRTGSNMLGLWILANGLLAGVGAVIALGHPLTIISSVLAAPLTSLNPMIAAGWVSGLVEAVSRKPKVKDFESLSEDISSVKGFWKNKVTRILLVVVFTNLGSIVGTAVALPLMLKVL
ncbi:Pheromone shutdown protein [Olavius algarvensis associated proteobacterium Delta 3]|nr:Pheromone shutdown protein [Olavius algarvensis associated proteobacterium Delta 3]CAB5166668.1 Pheromone shutdown protein [Olavius algarvensis associated proteobacterium Delta 3]